MRNRSKWLIAAVGVLILAGGTSALSFAEPGVSNTDSTAPQRLGWVKEDGNWLYYGWEENTNRVVPVRDEWKTSGMKSYYLGADGRMVVNDWVEETDRICRTGRDGARIENRIVEIDGEKYCFDEYGTMMANVLPYYFEGEPYFFLWNGMMITSDWGMRRSDGYLCYCGEDGRILRNGWFYLKEDSENRESSGYGWFYMDASGNVVREPVIEVAGGECHLDTKTGRWLEEPGDIDPSKLKQVTLSVPQFTDLEVGKTSTVTVKTEPGADLEVFADWIMEEGLAEVTLEGNRISVRPLRCGYGDFVVVSSSEGKLWNEILVQLEIRPSARINTGEIRVTAGRPVARAVTLGDKTASPSNAARRASASDADKFEYDAYVENGELAWVKSCDPETGRILIKSEAPGDAILNVVVYEGSGDDYIESVKKIPVVIEENLINKKMAGYLDEMETVCRNLDEEKIKPEQALEQAVSLTARVRTAMEESSIYEEEAWEYSNQIEGLFMEVLNRAGIEVDWIPEVDTMSEQVPNLMAFGVPMNIPARLLKPGAKIKCRLEITDGDSGVNLPEDVTAAAAPQVLNITLMIGEEGDLKPASVIYPIKFDMTMETPHGAEADDEWIVLHYTGNKGRVIPSITDMENKDHLAFEAYGFSSYAFVYGTYHGEVKIPTILRRTETRGGSGSESTAYVGQWIRDDKGWWYQYRNGTWPSNGWYYLEWNKRYYWYHFNGNGYLDTGWFTDSDGLVYYLHPLPDGMQGYMYTGWNQIDGVWYYFNMDSSNGKTGMLWKNGVTPDGYTVRADGSWVE